MPRAWSAARIAVLVVFAGVLAAISNLAASTDRKLAWVGSYPRALEVGPPSAAVGIKRETPAAGVSPAPSAPAGGPLAPPAEASSSAGRAPAAGAAPTPVSAGPTDSAKAFPPHPDKAAVEITPDDVQQLFRRKALFLDARRSSVYDEGHIAGARNFPVWESDIDARVKALYEEGLDQQAPVVVYCSGGNCEDSHMLAEKLYMVGFDNVLIYKDGFPDWQKRGLAVSKGTDP
ncbi:MAG: rhodanese-like domain-containing protein [Acidobacteriota bacterium]|nr:rhodanese-like domain-containing protein [Acidobacteriota bacterium]